MSDIEYHLDGSVCTCFEDAENMRNMGITAEAIDKVTGDRQKTYGNPRTNFDRIARLWDAYMTNKPVGHWHINAYDVPMFMILVKIAREQHEHNHDNLVDIIGYIKTLEMLYESE